jgi:hypothetical protein
MLTFAHPFCFWLLLSLAGPIILHLLNRQRLRTVVFPSIRFLRHSQIPQDGRRRLRDILRLLLRLAFLTAVIILLAGPKWTPPSETKHDTDAKTAIFLLDASASMATAGRLENGRKLLEASLKEHDGWRIGGIVFADKILSEATPSEGHEAIKTLIDEWKPSNTAGFPDDALKKAVTMLGTIGKRRLVIVSDFQLGDWNHRMPIVPSDVETVFLDAAEQPRIDNVGISDIQCRALGQNRLQIIVSVRNFALKPQKRTLSLSLPGQEIQPQDVEIRPKSVVRCPFVIENASPTGQGRAILSADDYQPDDSRLFWTAGKPPVSVLLVQADSAEAEEELFFTQKAFAAGTEEGLSEYKLTQGSFLSMIDAQLTDYQVIVLLSSAEELDEATANRLHEYMENGGVVFATGGGSASAALRTFQKANIPLAQSNGIAGTASRNAVLGVGPVTADSPLGSVFGDRTDHDLYLFPIRKHHRLKPLHDTTILLRSLEDQPLLLSRDIGRGRIYFFAMGFSREWSDLPLTNSFLPLLHELAVAAVPQDFGHRHLTCGDKYVLSERTEADTSKPALFMDGAIQCDVSIPLRESMTETINLDDLRQMLKTEAVTENTPAAAVDRTRDLSRWFAWLSAILLLLEIIL